MMRGCTCSRPLAGLTFGRAGEALAFALSAVREIETGERADRDAVDQRVWNPARHHHLCGVRNVASRDR